MGKQISLNQLVVGSSPTGVIPRKQQARQRGLFSFPLLPLLSLLAILFFDLVRLPQ